MISSRELRARRHAALGDANRLAIVDELMTSDRSPTQLGGNVGLPSNLVAHHLDVLEAAGLIERFASSGDGRRRYVRLRSEALASLTPPATEPGGSVLFVCTHNSARSQLAAALWTDRTGGRADSAGTHPADRVHPGAVAAARRAGLDLSRATPRLLSEGGADRAALVITVCDRANEELSSPEGWWHWSTPDPVADGTDDAFDATIDELDLRIAALR